MTYQHEYTEQILNGNLDEICVDLLQCVYPCDWSDLRETAINNGVPVEILDDIDSCGLSVILYAPGMTDRCSGFEYHNWEVSSYDGVWADLPKDTQQQISELQKENETTYLHLLAFAIEACGRMQEEIKEVSWFDELNESLKEANAIIEGAKRFE